MRKLSYNVKFDERLNGNRLMILEKLGVLVVINERKIAFFDLETREPLERMKLSHCQTVQVNESTGYMYCIDADNTLYHINLNVFEIEKRVNLNIDAELGEFCIYDMDYIIVEGWEETQNLYLCNINNGANFNIASIDWAEPTFVVNGISLRGDELIIDYQMDSISLNIAQNSMKPLHIEINNKLINIDFVVNEWQRGYVYRAKTYEIDYKVKGFLKKETEIILRTQQKSKTIAKLDFPLYACQKSMMIEDKDCVACLFGNALLLFAVKGSTVSLDSFIQFEKAKRLIVDNIYYDQTRSRLFFIGEDDCSGFVQFND